MKGSAVVARPKSLTAEQMRENSRIGGIKSQSPEVLAAKIARDWPELTPEQKSVVRAVLRPVLRPIARKAS
jgi:hypothetical protein